MRRTPALIVGGGLAGPAVALSLARAGLPHLLVERTAVTGDAICGGFLSWRSLATLADLGIDAEALGGARIRRVRLSARGRTAEAPLPRPAAAVSRRRLDTLLMDAAVAAGACVERGVEVRAIDGGVARLADGGTITGDALFLASGKHDIRGLARPAAARGADPTLGLRVRLPAAPALTTLVGDAIELHLFDRGYAGIVAQEDGSINVCLAVHRSRLAQAGSPAALLTELARDAALGERLAYLDADTPVDAIANVPYGWRATVGTPALFRLGDQAGVIPSLAGEGMGIALASGVGAAAAYARGGPDAAVAWQRDFARTTHRPIAVAGLIRRLAESRLAPTMLAFAHPRALRLLADLTRIAP